MNPRAARQASGMTRNEWARAMGVSVLTTKRWEQSASRYARSPTQHRVERMERVLTGCGVDLREVMGA